MTAAEFGALLALATATSFTPGPNTTLSTALAANFGLRRALRFVLAVPVGWTLLLTLCAAGVGALVLAAPLLRGAILMGGVAYLLWLAWRLAGSQTLASASTSSLNVTFVQGVGLQFLNIKAWMLALSIVAGWIAGQPDAWQRFGLVVPVMMFYAFSSNLAYALVGSVLRHWLAGPWVQGHPTGQRLRAFNRWMALALVLTAVWMSFSGLGATTH
ncbi:LysE family translocator [Tepidicella xavieri]|uniref:Threonine/homoserine/homoserine lactone efflux protein n=1 Tax=Tepidicella xavieri TaxID=360241 RepID=A0A4R6UC74_9BURK|nr:LysE family translocator [Tepidicella xavieri]TDQ44290.1 threonine/homoserine/homoserine lactone efflux protein [Tepidicella xavieri]